MKRALVTGASSAIGSAIAHRLAAEGHHVIAHAHRNTNATNALVDDILRAGGTAEALALDLLSPDAFSVLERLSDEAPIQILVHCVGGQRDVPFAAMSTEDWRAVVDLNLNSLFTALRPIIVPMMRARPAHDRRLLM